VSGAAPRAGPGRAGQAVALLRPGWPAPPGVGAAMSLRHGGVGSGPFDPLDLGDGTGTGTGGDDPARLAENRRRFAAAIGARPVWLRQVHGSAVLRLQADAQDAVLPPADAAWTDVPGLACTVRVADCLPVLLCRRDGAAVAAAHAGWRGLAAGVIPATVAALCEGSGCAPADLLAWIGPGIGPQRFEVGADVLQAFGAQAAPETGDPAFAWAPRPDGTPRWRADLAALARRSLARCGVADVTVHGGCTATDASAFFSFRRDGPTGRTGRMAAAVWRRG
jgi:YfiH family protein